MSHDLTMCLATKSTHRPIPALAQRSSSVSAVARSVTTPLNFPIFTPLHEPNPGIYTASQMCEYPNMGRPVCTAPRVAAAAIFVFPVCECARVQNATATPTAQSETASP